MRFVVLACVALLAGCAGNAGETLVRGTPPLDRSPAAAISADDFVAGSFTARDGTTLPYRLLTPAHIEPGRRYPLIVQFHGSGAIGSDNRAQVERDFAARAWAIPAIRARHPAFVLVPQFPVRSANYDDPMVPRSAVAAPALGAALELVDAVIARQPVDRTRLYASGFSMGGSATWLSLLARPDLFAAAVPISGIAPDRAVADQLTHVPILVLHGDADSENPIDADRAMVAAIRAAGGRQVRMRRYVGLAHMPPGDLVPGDRWRDWLFAQHRDP
ncbi:MAG TPA: prolyl oligopeptidase family serine peptidase [Thermomonas sp.]|jgi:predicted peptidase|nr:prolyl oligopeptidase family serine peptidase [Thermomonas sp.]HOZ24330.1 prolyl oligopeptidase family serine peptidase [Thermomonas sp.]HPM57724.1 prolyl oligopeptidase family serine peptidase [Thermomonas sp.]HPW13364.1 prolyl oligopeptidase family serine peptidase [Thermomonas sp.]